MAAGTGIVSASLLGSSLSHTAWTTAYLWKNDRISQLKTHCLIPANPHNSWPVSPNSSSDSPNPWSYSPKQTPPPHPKKHNSNSPLPCLSLKTPNYSSPSFISIPHYQDDKYFIPSQFMSIFVWNMKVCFVCYPIGIICLCGKSWRWWRCTWNTILFIVFGGVVCNRVLRCKGWWCAFKIFIDCPRLMSFVTLSSSLLLMSFPTLSSSLPLKSRLNLKRFLATSCKFLT